MNENKPPLYLVTGLLIGLGLGLLISVIIFPSRTGEGSPAQLSEKDKITYRGLVAQSYAIDNNLQRAAARLALLEEEDSGRELAAQAQRLLAEGKTLAEAEILARLASALQAKEPQADPVEDILLFTPGPAELTRTPSPDEEDAPPPNEDSQPPILNYQPTPSPAPTLGAPFALAERKIICDPDREQGLIEVEVEDQAGNPIPGVRIDISWLDGQEFFFTGMIPEVNSGFADFIMTTGQEYSLRVGEGGEQARGIGIPECTNDDGSKYYGSIYLRFMQP